MPSDAHERSRKRLIGYAALALAVIEAVAAATSLHQVIDDLLGKLRGHTPPGTAVRVSAEPEADGAAITVADNGPSMEPDEATHIFERFYRSDSSRSMAQGGAGLGLSILSAIVANHGSTVSAQGEVGEGTASTVHLPPGPPPEDEQGQESARPGRGLPNREPDTATVDLRPSDTSASTA